MPANQLETDPARLRSQQARVFWLLWSAYASYYLCRVNFAVAQPAILKEFPTWTAAQIGTIPSAYAAVYAIGQIVNGTLGQDCEMLGVAFRETFLHEQADFLGVGQRGVEHARAQRGHDW